MTSLNELVPLAEHFHSVQGEGEWVGTPMHFIRLSGCPVGSEATKDFITLGKGAIPILEDGVRGSKCKTYDGRFFDCDTNFHQNIKTSFWDLLEETYEKRICLTGGEPLAHLGKSWFRAMLKHAEAKEIHVHIETSGTIYDPEIYQKAGIWVTVSPKYRVLEQCLEKADEVKLLVDENFRLSNVPNVVFERKFGVFVCPINGEKNVNQKNVLECMALLTEHPEWKLSVQLHKFIGVR